MGKFLKEGGVSDAPRGISDGVPDTGIAESVLSEEINRRDFLKILTAGVISGILGNLSGCATTRGYETMEESESIYESFHNQKNIRALQLALNKKVRNYPYKNKDVCIAFLDYKYDGLQTTVQDGVASGSEKMTADGRGKHDAWFLRQSNNFKGLHRGKDVVFQFDKKGNAEKIRYRDMSSLAEWLEAIDDMGWGGKIDIMTFFYKHSGHWKKVVRDYNTYKRYYPKKTKKGFGVSPNTHVVEVLNNKEKFEYVPLRSPVSVADLIRSMQNRDTFRSSSPKKNKNIDEILAREGKELIRLLDIKIIGANGKKRVPRDITEKAQLGEKIVWKDRLMVDFIHIIRGGKVIPKARVMTATEMLLDGRFVPVELFRGPRLYWSDATDTQEGENPKIALLEKND